MKVASSLITSPVRHYGSMMSIVSSCRLETLKSVKSIPLSARYYGPVNNIFQSIQFSQLWAQGYLRMHSLLSKVNRLSVLRQRPLTIEPNIHLKSGYNLFYTWYPWYFYTVFNIRMNVWTKIIFTLLIYECRSCIAMKKFWYHFEIQMNVMQWICTCTNAYI